MENNQTDTVEIKSLYNYMASNGDFFSSVERETADAKMMKLNVSRKQQPPKPIKLKFPAMPQTQRRLLG